MGFFDSFVSGYAQTFYPKKNEKITPVFPDLGGVGMVGMGAAKTIWGGLGTTGKVGVGIIGGAGGYAAYDWLFGGKKQPMAPQTQVLEQKPVQQTTNNLNYKYDARQYTQNTTNVDNRSWMNIINSPGASMTKKDTVAATATATPSITTPFSFTSDPTQDTSADQGQSQASGMDWATIAAIAGVALVAYGYTSRKGSK
ncbi:MAG: hypothetical protein OIN86_13615 [Candidatus Methanoperedens sp.]|nr:hypothetical protein [Candidatus Methanoperedens sp.]CAG0950672.1 hypothetical protein METP1_00180 [Methanosarcinales archaeon]